MTTPAALRRDVPVRLRHRLAACAAVLVARPMAALPPRHIRTVLGVLSRGARPASHSGATRARDAVVAVSLRCAGSRGCLPRSLATALLCRMWGTWPRWCAGVRVVPPFGAHAWVEAEGRPVGERVPGDYFRRLVAVPGVRRG